MVLDGDAQVTLTDVEIADNKAGDGGGGFATAGRASLVATRLIVADNETHGGGRRRLHRHRAPGPDQGLDVLRQQGRRRRSRSMPRRPPADRLPGLPDLGDERQRRRRRRPLHRGRADRHHRLDASRTTSPPKRAAASASTTSARSRITDSVVRGNLAGADGGGIENSGMRVTFDHLLVESNKATLDGGGIYNSSSDEFTVIDSTIQKNLATNGGGFANAPDADLHHPADAASSATPPACPASTTPASASTAARAAASGARPTATPSSRTRRSRATTRPSAAAASSTTPTAS